MNVSYFLTVKYSTFNITFEDFTQVLLVWVTFTLAKSHFDTVSWPLLRYDWICQGCSTNTRPTGAQDREQKAGSGARSFVKTAGHDGDILK